MEYYLENLLAYIDSLCIVLILIYLVYIVWFGVYRDSWIACFTWYYIYINSLNTSRLSMSICSIDCTFVLDSPLALHKLFMILNGIFIRELDCALWNRFFLTLMSFILLKVGFHLFKSICHILHTNILWLENLFLKFNYIFYTCLHLAHWT